MTPGWYYAEGDPPGTTRYWDGEMWVGEPVAAPAATAPGAVAGVGNLASPGSRMGARVIDFFIGIGIALILLLFGLGGSSDDVVLNNDDGFEFSFSAGLDSSIEYLLYGLLGWAWAAGWTHLKGGTPGKLILGMRVADANTGTTPVDIKQALIRTGVAGLQLLGVLGSAMAGLAGFAALIIGLVSLILLFTDDQHRTVMDRVASTLVITK